MKNDWLIKDVAKLCGVSIRLLHHWDYVGLVSPSSRLPNGYRLYSAEDIERIQQALVYRETGMSLEKIKEILENSPSKEQHLRIQLELLEEASVQLQKKIQAVHQILEEHMKGKTLTIEEKAALMGKDWLPEWESEAEKKWGETVDWKESQFNLSKMTAKDWQVHREEVQRIEKTMSMLYSEGSSPDSEPALDIIEEYRKVCSKYHFEITHSKHVILGQMYVSDSRFRDYYEQYSPGFAQWIFKSIQSNAQRHGVDPVHVEWK